MFTNITEPHGFLNYLFVELPGKNFVYDISLKEIYIFHSYYVLDPRVKQWPLMNNPVWTIGILLFYLYFVNLFGPNLMKNRKPLKLKKTLILYNFFQVIASIYLFCEVFFILCFIFLRKFNYALNLY